MINAIDEICFFYRAHDAVVNDVLTGGLGAHCFYGIIAAITLSATAKLRVSVPGA